MADKRYYTEGSSARKLNYDSRYEAAPAPARRREYRPADKPQPARRRKQKVSHLTNEERAALAQRRTERKAEMNAQIRYTTGVVAAIIVAVALLCYLLKLNSDVKAEKEAVASLKSQVAAQLDENAGYSAGLDSMVDLNEIYEVATTKLGMVYSQPGQTLYYSQNKDDYVVQYKDVPDAK